MYVALEIILSFDKKIPLFFSFLFFPFLTKFFYG